jgi:ketol-acid reductoisomerase
MAQWYFDGDADLKYLDNKTIGIFGYGNQGQAQALNMRDSGLRVIVGNRLDASYEQAAADGFAVYSWSEAAARSDILFLLMPDEVMPAIYDEQIAAHLEAGNVLVFASGYNIHFKHLRPPDFVDVILIAPRMIGKGVRDTFLSGEGFPSLIAVHQDASGQGLERTLALSKGIGSTKMGIIVSSFEEETIVDLFSEQIGGLYAIRRYFEALVEAGCGPEVVLLELYASGEGIATARAYRDLGLWEQITLHSRTSQYGQEVTSRVSPEEESAERQRIGRVIEHIRSGAFAREWKTEQESGFEQFGRIRQENLAHPMIVAERELYRILGRIKK